MAALPAFAENRSSPSTPYMLVDQPISDAEKAEVATQSGVGDNATALAKKLANPVASLISVPFQFNYDEGFGRKDAYKLTLNVQPVIPITLNEDWNLIVRTPRVRMADPNGACDSVLRSCFRNEPNPSPTNHSRLRGQAP